MKWIWLVSRDAAVHVESGDSGGGLFVGHVHDGTVLPGPTSALITDDAGGLLVPALRQRRSP